MPNEADLAAARADSAAASSSTQPALVAAANADEDGDEENDDEENEEVASSIHDSDDGHDDDHAGVSHKDALQRGKSNVPPKGGKANLVRQLPPSSARWGGKGRGRGGPPAGRDAVPPPSLPPAPAPAPAPASKKLSSKEQAKADLARSRLVDADEYAKLKESYDEADGRGEYDAMRASIAASPRYAPPDSTAVPTTDEWAQFSLPQKRLWLFGHFDGELKWRAALNGGKATKAHCDAAHKTALEVARSLAVVLAPRGTGARDPDANDPKKGPADHAALLRVRRGEGQPLPDMAEDRVAWISRNFKTYYADKMAWFKECPGMSHSTALLVPNHTHAAIQPIHPPVLVCRR